MAAIRASKVRAAALRKRCFNLANTCSSGGFRSANIWEERTAWRRPAGSPGVLRQAQDGFPLWLPGGARRMPPAGGELSMITRLPGASAGASTFST
jgi:hypothetical protein